MDNQENPQLIQFKGKNVIVGLKNGEEYEGKLIAIDNFINPVLENEGQLRTIKGGKVLFISIKE
ncbi:LSM domain-containing protein [Methanobrevibacter woesei]|uniref:LSM domain-containing protein n=1 Tax=Methanobrevibacter woesei TaxID=190976 RepID=UPI0023F3EF29|nr:LSM domain-containing protein [Methanobrevibacter woesei]MCI7292001.1 LSM domain protein [Methanobrevibacter woesei]